MKKLISLVIAAAMTVSMFGCGHEEKKPVTPPANPPVEAKTDEAPPATPAADAAPAPEAKAP